MRLLERDHCPASFLLVGVVTVLKTQWVQQSQIGSKPITITTMLTYEEWLVLIRELGHVYQLSRVNRNADGTAEIEFKPGNGMLKFEVRHGGDHE